ncbi:peptidoglycan-binding domain-containing protein [Streptomyces neyagawaensis]|uniref:peptidoglycan-binding domain-containing protein n=1 Tax=Streptomyces neyagawaensis TaxID=42238 RepID=UPI0006E37CB0|nr:peptidoglycan-binding protein [Streptomyces neyagawaensis]MCL6732751.1 peptidoglycan-binding protein [Streptomyces neyagawaensis]MDE1681479.1 peptidoglycan-binding protein [Streptomyces neyagawaensis]
MDGSPSCGCGRRAAEALLETRTAEAAAAEDFDPLRIRPYVELGDAGDDHGQRNDTGPLRDRGHARGPGHAEPAEAATKRLAAFRAPRTTPPADDHTRPLTVPPPASSSGRSSTPARPRSAGRRRRTGLIVALGGTAAAGVMAAAGLMSGLFSYEAPERNGALPDDVRASAPDTTVDGDKTPVRTPEEATEGGAPAPAPPPGGAGRAKPSGSPSPSPSKSSASPSASPSPSPSKASPSARASDKSTADDANKGDSRLEAPKTLRLGDKDPEVTELQLRLRQLGLYNGDIDQNFDREVEQAVIDYQTTRAVSKDDEPGVYGLATRTRLEAETEEP